jgi:hypothetical protein
MNQVLVKNNSADRRIDLHSGVILNQSLNSSYRIFRYRLSEYKPLSKKTGH